MLPGIIIEAAGLGLDESMFGCCAGTGFRDSACGKLASACSLGTRLGALRRLAKTFDSLAAPAGRSLAEELTRPSPAALKPALVKLAALRSGATRRGLVLSRDAGARAVDGLSVWALAATAAWRFGFEPHVASLDRGAPDELVPRAREGGGDVIIVVETNQGLWDAQAAYRLEYLVTWAYNAMAPLFVELVRTTPVSAAPLPSASAAGGPRHVRQAFAHRIGAQKARPAADWLEPDTVSKLLATCDDAETLGLGAGKFGSRRPTRSP